MTPARILPAQAIATRVQTSSLTPEQHQTDSRTLGSSGHQGCSSSSVTNNCCQYRNHLLRTMMAIKAASSSWCHDSGETCPQPCRPWHLGGRCCATSHAFGAQAPSRHRSCFCQQTCCCQQPAAVRCTALVSAASRGGGPKAILKNDNAF